jgi:2-oxoglutarate dehydrogenase E2 component (dihydrolipoamide succinyltransferase)
MSNQILVPSLGESVTEATVSKWLKQEGEKVDTDEPLVELETDKVNVEVPSPLSGILGPIQVKEGDTVEVGSLLGTVNDEKTISNKVNEIPKLEKEKINTSEQEKVKNKTKKEKKTKNKKVVLQNEEPLNLINETKESPDSKVLVLETLAEDETNNLDKESYTINEGNYVPPKSRNNLSPAVRKIIKEKNIDITNIEGTGKSGRISKGDLINLMGNTPQPSKRKITHGEEETVKMTRLRLTIAKRLKAAQDSAAMLTTFNEVDMNNVMQTRKNYQEDFQKKYSVKLGFMSFFVKAAIVALKNYPAINAEIEGENIIYKNYYNISIAIGTDRGLVVPVLKKADELSFADIERNIFSLSEKAKKGKITIDDLQGGTFTISNGGIYGSMLSTPILNPPQTGILGMHNIIERPVVIEGNITVRPIMYLALSYDHRIIDGKEAVSFLKNIKECLEEPRRLFLDI